VKYRPRSVPAVEARKWMRPGDHPAVDRKMRAEGGKSEYGLISRENILVMPGDYVITLPDGRHRALRQDIFEAEYEPVGEP